MDKSIITFSANEQNLQKTGGIGCYASDTVSYIEAHFALGENWSGYDSIRAVRTGADMTQSERCGSMTIRQSAPYLIPMVFALFRMRYWSTEVRSWSILSALFWFLTSFQTA